MTNKIILELPDKTEIEAENISFIQLHGENTRPHLGQLHPLQMWRGRFDWSASIQNLMITRTQQLQALCQAREGRQPITNCGFLNAHSSFIRWQQSLMR